MTLLEDANKPVKLPSSTSNYARDSMQLITWYIKINTIELIILANLV